MNVPHYVRHKVRTAANPISDQYITASGLQEPIFRKKSFRERFVLNSPKSSTCRSDNECGISPYNEMTNITMFSTMDTRTHTENK